MDLRAGFAGFPARSPDVSLIFKKVQEGDQYVLVPFPVLSVVGVSETTCPAHHFANPPFYGQGELLGRKSLSG